ncbi:hypothetical protein B296_00023136 [Ensete ventricosum]|uniref:Uncharacterized protein n=1 Tax=Ensete ventricosum TaxID=4639 RepID=A0A426ZHH9_ENSVE|nr:hypothetical protein B296_00023136 [Ensete ventricosum]
MAAFAASSPAATAVLGGARLSSSLSAASRTPVLHLPPPPRRHFSTHPLPLSCGILSSINTRFNLLSLYHADFTAKFSLADVARFASLRVRASSSSEESSGSVQTDELLTDLKEKVCLNILLSHVIVS